jgi:cellulose synthase/poly-beta-1,6-N-acetylglucosamine synthase-like glycosyltransferase
VTIVFWACVALLAYTYAGYPLLMRLLAWLRPVGAATSPGEPPVTAILVVHDGGTLVRAKLDNLLALDWPADRLEIVVACDGCSDGTAAACRTVGDPRVRVLEFTRRRGKAACLNDAVAAARGEILLMVDVRQRVDVRALRELVARLADPAVGAASGELCFEDPESGFARSVDAYWRYEKMLRQAESRSGSVVGVTGALYVLRRALFQPLPGGTVLDDVLVPMRVAARGSRVVFEQRAVAWDRASPSPAQERARKVRTLAGNFQLLQLAPWLLNPLANPLWFRFVSHKLLRLVAPWAILALLAATCVLATRGGFYLACLWLAATAMLLLLLARVLPPLSRSLPVRLLSAFFHMNLYSAEAAIAFARRDATHLW